MKKLGILLAVGLVVIGGLATKALLGGPSDDQLIGRALDDAIAAAKEGKSGAVLDFLSRRFQLGDNAQASRAMINRFIQESKPNIIIRDPRPKIDGDQAVIASPVDAKFEGNSFGLGDMSFDAVIRLERETGYENWIIPKPVWRVVSVEGAPVSE